MYIVRVTFALGSVGLFFYFTCIYHVLDEYSIHGCVFLEFD